MADDGRTVALPLTQEQAEGHLNYEIDKASGGVLFDETIIAIRKAVLSAPVEVLAAAMGGTVRRTYKCEMADHPSHDRALCHPGVYMIIELPPRGDEHE